jgi:putative transposase
MRRRNRRVIVHNIPYFITCRTLLGVGPPPIQDLASAVLHALSCLLEKWQCRPHAYVVMPDHWHALLTTSPPNDISRVMTSVKTQSALKVGRTVKGIGTIWQPGFHDHVCRNEDDFFNALTYIHWNPVAAELVASPEAWPWSSWYAYAEGGSPPIPTVPIGGSFDSRWAEWHRHPGPRAKWPRWLH